MNTHVYSSIIFSAGYGMAGLTTKALSNQKGTAAGTGMIFKLGFMPTKQFEIGPIAQTVTF